MQFDRDTFLLQFQNLSTSPDKNIRDTANNYILQLQKSDEVWNVARDIYLNGQNDQIQFLGIQMLAKKIKTNFSTLDENKKNSLKEFIFSQISNSNNIGKLAFQQLCKAAALMAVFLLTTTWENFFDDLFNFMSQNSSNLYGGLAVIEEFTNECDQVIIEKKRLIKIKCYITEEIPNKFIDLFINIFTKITDRHIIDQSLNTLRGLANFKLQFLNSENLISILLRLIDSDIYYEKINDILCDILKFSIHAEILNDATIKAASKEISFDERTSINRIIEYLGVNKYEQFLKEINNHDSTFCKNFTEIVVTLALKFPIFILESTEFSNALIRLLLISTTHINNTISNYTFEFWTALYQVCKKSIPDITNVSYDYIFVAYVELYKILIEKCKLKSFKLKANDLTIYSSPRKHKLNLDSDTKIEKDELEEDQDSDKMTMVSYRTYTEDVFYTIYRMLKEFRGEAGVSIFFKLVFDRFDKNFYLTNYSNLNNEELTTQYILSIEVTIFSVKCVLDNILFKESDINIHKIIALVISELPFQNIIVKTTLQFLYDASNQFKFSLDLVDNVFKYILQFIMDRNLGKLSSQTFCALTEVLNNHTLDSMFELCFNFINNNIDIIEEEYIYDNLIQGIFNLALKFQINEKTLISITKILTIIDSRFEALNTNSNKSKFIFKKICHMINSALISLDSGTEENKIGLKQIIIAFLDKNINNFILYFIELSYELEYCELFVKLFKLILKSIQNDSINYSNTIIDAIFKIFQQNPKRNSFVLNLFSFLITTLDTDKSIEIWLNANYSQFNKFLINVIIEYKDPDLIKNFVEIQARILIYNDLIFFISNEYEQIMKIIFESFININEYGMTKEILLFLNIFVGIPKRIDYPNFIIKFVPEILNVILFTLPELNRNFIHYNVQILQTLIKNYNQLDLINYIRISLNSEKYKLFTENEKSILIESLFTFIDNSRFLKMLLNDISSYLNLSTTNDFFLNLQLQLKENYSHNLKKDQILEIK